jgi:hypothetical protein
MEFEINDIRKESDFKGITFSKFKKTDVSKKLLNGLKDAKLEESIYMSVELICAGHYQELWDVIIKYIGKYIHLGNPKLPIYIWDRFDKFKELINNGYIGNELSIRNNNNLRLLFCEIICVLCESNRKNSFEKIKLSNNEFDMFKLKNYLKADNTDYVKPVFDSADPKELLIAFNEFNYNLNLKIPNTYNCCFWVEWILEYEKRCKKRKVVCIGLRRNLSVEQCFQCDIIWLLWDYLLLSAKNQNSIIFKIMENLYKLFSIRYNNSCKNKRKYLILFGIHLCTEPVNLDIRIINDGSKINLINQQINSIYKQIKKNEIAPSTDYLFNNNVTKTNLEKTIEKLDKIRTIDSFIPRIDG